VLLREATGARRGVRIRIQKRIPVAAGLGGGSSNAAVTLLALIRLWGLSVTEGELLELGARIGSDVPFFFYGGTALGVGRGEEVYPLPDVDASHVLVVVPDVEVSTAWAYSQLTKKTEKSNIPVSCATVFRASREWDAAGARLLGAAGNDLEAVIFDYFPAVGQIFDQLVDTRAQVVRMSGSGPTLFAVFDSQEALAEAEQRVARGPARTWRTRTVRRREYMGAMGL
jgi:4-diphosphocytidyl-2-C-methyl-D-erythritol kinase